MINSGQPSGSEQPEPSGPEPQGAPGPEQPGPAPQHSPAPSVPPVAQQPVPEGELRVSDSERDATLQTLGHQAAEGRLTLDELEERASQALAAKTRTDLATVTRDLPAEPAPGPRKTPVRWFVAIMGGSRRRGRFRAGSQVNGLAIMGGDEIDLREAEIDGSGLTLNLYSIMGGSTIYLPDSVDVEISGFAIMGRQRGTRPGLPPPSGRPGGAHQDLQPDGR